MRRSIHMVSPSERVVLDVKKGRHGAVGAWTLEVGVLVLGGDGWMELETALRAVARDSPDPERSEIDHLLELLT